MDESVTVFPPFYCEFGRNLTFGKDVFVNMGCRFQDAGGISIGDGTLIGHGTTLTTLNHGLDPARRADMTPAPIVIGRSVWFGAGVTVVPGVTVGAGAIVGAGSCSRDEGRAGQRSRRRCPGQGHPPNRVRGPLTTGWHHCRRRCAVALQDDPRRDGCG